MLGPITIPKVGIPVQALVSSWKNGNTMPFIFDTVWDLIKLADYLTLREDVDPSNIGITGESLGGMHAWFAAFVDTRYSVVVPIIGVQGFQWAIEHDKWQARVNSIKAVFDARADLDKSTIDKEVVQKVWDRIAPGFSSQFDSPYTVPIIAPRPFLILNGEDDPRSPLGGLKIPESRAHKAYEEANCPRDFKAFIAFAMRQAQLTIAFVIQGSHSRSFSPRSLRVRVDQLSLLVVCWFTLELGLVGFLILLASLVAAAAILLSAAADPSASASSLHFSIQ
uniref:Peptidase S9 prolyl oligopeptidase catalytic domain-containing protein n=1 Tax=Nicotiana tabacum TaxID=4097 RepID=A0A1S3YDL8_TOBAC